MKNLMEFSADYEKIISIVENGSKVLDLGCGNGELLHRLMVEKNVRGRGVEIDEKSIIECITKGLSVFQGNIDEGLAEYKDKSYDYVILNKTLQVTYKPEFVVKEMLRVGKKVIVCFPNFAYWRTRGQLFFYGRMPKIPTLPFEWYDTPNIRLLTVSDFLRFCKNHNIKILDKYYINEYRRNYIAQIWPNMFASAGLFVLSDKQ